MIINSVIAKVSGGGGGGVEGGYNVSFYVNGSLYAYYSVTQGQSIGEPTSPTSTSGVFQGWFSASSGGDQITFPYTPSGDVSIYAQFGSTEIVGADGFDSASGVLTWTDAISECADNTTSTSGNYVSMSSELMDHFPYNQIEEVTDSNNNVFTRFPKLYMKWIRNSSNVITGVRFSNVQADDDYFIPDCFLDPSDTTGSTYLDYVDIGKYEGSGSSTHVVSVSGATCLVNITRAQGRTGCQYYGASSNAYNGYQQLDFAIFTMYNWLAMVFLKNSNAQNVYAGRTSQSSANATGSCDGVTGLTGWNTSTTCVKILGVENPYGNIQKWVDGIYFSGTTIYVHRFPTQYADSTTNGVVMGFARPSTSNYVNALRSGTSTETQSYTYASSASGTSDTYYGDYSWYSSSGVGLGVGGYWSNGAYAGLWCLSGFAASVSDIGLGCRLSRRPL